MLESILYSAFEQNIIILIQTYLMVLAPFFKLVHFLTERNLTLIIILILYLVYDKKLAKIMAISLTFCSAITMALKSVVVRKRPYNANSLIQCIQSPGEHIKSFSAAESHQHSHMINDSFPSGHSSSGAAFYGSIANYVRNKYVTIICAFLIALIGFSRIFIGVHFPSDVIIGIIIGLLSVFFVSYLFKNFDSYKPYLIVFAILLAISIVFANRRFLFIIPTFLGYSLAFLFEEKFVDFKITRNIVPAVSRIACGIILYIVLEYVFSMGIFNSMMLKSITQFFTCFILFGLYPWIFNRIPIFLDN